MASLTESPQHERVQLWMLAAASFVLQLPFLNRGISHYDEGSILAIADALRRGEVLYRDRVTTLAPLTYELMRALFDLFGPHLLIGRLVEAVVFTLCTMLIYGILRFFVGSRWALWGAVAFLAVKPLGFPLWTMINYSQIAMLFCLAAVLATLHFLWGRRGWWLLAAGFGVGMTAITKQNLGALLGLTLGVTVTLDGVREHRFGAVITRGVVMLAGALPPIAAVVWLYAARGALPELADQTIFGLSSFVKPYAVPLPWFYGVKNISTALFAYLPTPLLHLSWDGYLDVFVFPLVLPIGGVVLVLYLLPLLALALGVWLIWRGRRCAMPRTEWSGLVLLVFFAAAAYQSMLYRADWSHLMNVVPAFLLLCVVVSHRLLAASVWGRRVAVAAQAAWLSVGLLVAVAIFIVYRSPVITSRGSLLVPPHEAEDTNAVLSYLEQQPQREHILFLRAEPLYYFFSGRSIPGRFDLVMPGIVNASGDADLASILPGVDQVVYNPKSIPTVPSPLMEYAPHLAQTLSERFRIAEIIAPTACVLAPSQDGNGTGSVAMDFWDDYDHLQQVTVGDRPEIAHEFERTNWMMYRVLSSMVLTPDLATCFYEQVTVSAGDVLEALPLFHPDTWIPRLGDPLISAGAFQIDVLRPTPEHSERVYYAELPPGKPTEPVRIPLDAFADKRVTLHFCTAVRAERAPTAAHALLGWAEPRIVRAAAH